VQLEGIGHAYRGAGDVLAGVDLRVEPGRPAVITGANGSGKSTLLRVVAGCLRPARGRVRGRPDVVGYLPAPFPTTPRLSVRRTLRHLDAVHGLPSGASSPALRALGFTGDLAGPVAALSTGNATKVGLAQALAVGTGLVVLDEPWTALDDAAADALTELLAERRSPALTVIADHSGRAAALPGATTHRLHHARLTDQADETVAFPGWTHIELNCRGPADVVVRRLPAAVTARCTGHGLHAVVGTPHADAWLAAALAQGCSVVAVHRSAEPP
jgi:ABC-2 type transport system ATP-binding protein